MTKPLRVVGARQTEMNLLQLSRGAAGQAVTASMTKGVRALEKAASNRYQLLRDPKTANGKHVDQNLAVEKTKGRSRLDPSFKMGGKVGTRAVSVLHLIENGTAPHYQPKLGITHPGARANPIMEQTFRTDGPRVIELVATDLEAQFRRQVARLRTRARTR